MLSVNPNLDADDVWSMMVQTARRNLPSRGTEKWNVETGWGLIDAGEAVKEAARLSPVDLVYGGFGRLFTLHTGYDSRLNLPGGGLTRITAYHPNGSQLGQVTFSDPNWRGRFIASGTDESRVTMVREIEDGTIALDVVDPVNWPNNPQPIVSRPLFKDQNWRLVNMTVGRGDEDPRLLWKWEIAGTGPGWNTTYYRLDRLAASNLATIYSTIIQPPATEFVARDMATDWYGNNYVLWQSFRTGAIQIRVYNPTFTAILTNSPLTKTPLPEGGTPPVGESLSVVHPRIEANTNPNVVEMAAVSLSVTTDGVCYILFKSARGSHEIWKWARNEQNVWDEFPTTGTGPTRARYTVSRYDVVNYAHPDKIFWPTGSLYDSFSINWPKANIFREWAKSLAVNPVDNLPRVLTVKEGRSAEIWHLPAPTQQQAFEQDAPGASFNGTKTILSVQNFP